METAKDILEMHFHAKTIHYPGWAGVFPVENEALILALREITDKAWEAALKWDSDASQDHPDKSTFMKSLFP